MDFRPILTIGVLPIVLAQVSAAPRGALKLHLHIYNLANVPPRNLERALCVTARILGAAGIETAWEPGAVDAAEAHAADISAPAIRRLDDRKFLAVRIVTGFPTHIWPNALAFSLPAARSGAHVTIFYDRIENVSRLTPAAGPDILGNALAHEIGHVLLGSEEHALRGIMKARWTHSDYQSLSICRLGFSPHEVAAMRAEVFRRAQR